MSNEPSVSEEPESKGASILCFSLLEVPFSDLTACWLPGLISRFENVHNSPTGAVQLPVQESLLQIGIPDTSFRKVTMNKPLTSHTSLGLAKDSGNLIFQAQVFYEDRNQQKLEIPVCCATFKPCI